MGKIYDWLADRGNQKAVATGAAGLGAATAVHLGFDTKIDGKSLYDMTESAIRFIPYGIAALSMGKANEMRFSHEVGRPLSARERIHAYLDGAVFASGIMEGWEYLGQFVQPWLQPAFGEYVKKEFVAQGSAMDMIATTLGTGAIIAAKEYLSWRRKKK